MTTPLILGNWKMNTTLDDALTLVRATAAASDAAVGAVDVGVCPPYPWLIPIRDAVRDTSLLVGAQTCAATPNGAHTGDVSAAMLAECCTFTLIGHSERRAQHGETDESIANRLQLALDAGLGAILCVGETKDERDAGKATVVVQRQLRVALADIPHALADRLTIAYEPVWAIGTGEAATERDAADMAAAIRSDLNDLLPSGSDRIRILYGGSATDSNAGAFLAAEGIDGLLVGGASLSAPVFTAMIETAAGRGRVDPTAS